MQKAIKIHCQHCAVWQVVPIKSKPGKVVKSFQILSNPNHESRFDEFWREEIWQRIIENTEPPMATYRANFEGGGYYINGIPQAREIHTDDSDGKRLDIIGNFSEYYCEG